VWGIRLSDFDIMMVQEVLWTVAFFLRGGAMHYKTKERLFWTNEYLSGTNVIDRIRIVNDCNPRSQRKTVEKNRPEIALASTGR
jgi:hypothetical protein